VVRDVLGPPERRHAATRSVALAPGGKAVPHRVVQVSVGELSENLPSIQSHRRSMGRLPEADLRPAT